MVRGEREGHSDSDSVYFNNTYMYKYMYVHNIYNSWHSIAYNCGYRLRHMYL